MTYLAQLKEEVCHSNQRYSTSFKSWEWYCSQISSSSPLPPCIGIANVDDTQTNFGWLSIKGGEGTKISQSFSNQITVVSHGICRGLWFVFFLIKKQWLVRGHPVELKLQERAKIESLCDETREYREQYCFESLWPSILFFSQGNILAKLADVSRIGFWFFCLYCSLLWHAKVPNATRRGFGYNPSLIWFIDLCWTIMSEWQNKFI